MTGPLTGLTRSPLLSRGALVATETTGPIPVRAVAFQYNPDEMTRPLQARAATGGNAAASGPATNEALRLSDSAFLRQLQFVISFPFPGAAGRAEICRRIFPPQLPTEGLVVDKLARPAVAGGTIRNIALSARYSRPRRASRCGWRTSSRRCARST